LIVRTKTRLRPCMKWLQAGGRLKRDKRKRRGLKTDNSTWKGCSKKGKRRLMYGAKPSFTAKIRVKKKKGGWLD